MSITEETRQRVLSGVGKMSPFFVANVGQTDARIDYYARGSSHEAYFSPGKVLFAFMEKPVPSQVNPTDSSAFRHTQQRTDDQPVRGVRLSLQFLGANPDVKPAGQRLSEGKVNYLKGNDPTKWHTDIPTFEQVVYSELWPGIDLVFRGEDKRIKHEFVIRPGASAADIRFSYRGAEALSLDDWGNLLIHTEIGELTDARPVSYQEIDGRHIPVSSAFLVEQQEDGEYIVSFRIGDEYRPGYPLIIDPVLEYSTYLGGGLEEFSGGIAVDTFGNAYVIGSTITPETNPVPFPITPGAFQTTIGGGLDAFVTKLNASGTALVYSTYLGGSNGEQGFGIAVDAAGNAYVTGNTTSRQTDPVPFPITPGAFQTTFGGASDAFAAKLNAAGNALLYSTYLGGSDNEVGFDIAVDALGNAYVTGFTFTTETDPVPFPITPGAFQTTFGGIQDVFVTKLNATGSVLLYSTYLGGSQIDVGIGIEVDSAGNAYVTGSTFTPETDPVPFPITPGAFQTAFGGGSDAFVTKLNAAGNTLLYSTYLGGSRLEVGVSIAIDTIGSAYITGRTETPDTDPIPYPVTPGAFQTTFGGIRDAFVAKLNAVGSSLLYSTYLGGGQSDEATGIDVDSLGNAYVTGFTATPETDPVPFPITANAFQPNYGGGPFDAFVTKLNTTGNALAYSTYLGGGQTDTGSDIAVDAFGNAYVLGSTFTPETDPVPFPITPGAFQTTFGGVRDAFVAKISTPTPPPTLAPTPSPTAAPLIPNNVQEECIRVQKVYDWVVTANRDRNKVPIPDDCRPLVDAAIRAGQNITIQCVEPIVPPTFPLIPKPQPTQSLDFSCNVIGIRRETIVVNGNVVPAGIVRFLFGATLLVRIFANGTLLCEFPATIQFDDEIVLCLPEPLDESNILCRITAVECMPTNTVLLGGMVELEVMICKEIQVEAEVKLEVLAKFCQPRPIIPVPAPTPSFVCPPFRFPPQCPDLFPRRNCDCQGTANALITNSVAFFDGVAEVGTEQLLADICPSCDPGAGTFSYTFIDTVPTTPTPTDEILGDFSFVYTPVQISSPTCTAVPGGGLQLVITATGIRTFTASGTTETLSAELTLQELPGAFDTFRLVLRSAIGAVVFDTQVKSVSDANVNAQDCIALPDVIPSPSFL